MTGLILLKMHEIQRKKTTGCDIVRLLFGDEKK